MESSYKRKYSRQAGFSLIEILVVITILASLMGIVAVNVIGAQDEAKINQATIEIRTLEESLNHFKMMEGRYPTKAEGLKRLTEPCGRAQKPILEEIPVDPWDNDYVYIAPVKSSEKPIVLTYGADAKLGGEEGVDADISSLTIREDKKK